MKTMKDYHDLYLKWDVLLLADAFEKFRNNSIKNCGLCPSHSLSTPTLSWDAILNMTKVELSLFQTLICIYSLKNVREVEFLISLIDIVKPTIIISNLTAQNKNQKILCT